MPKEVYSAFLERLDQYRDLSRAYLARGVDQTRNPDDKENARDDWRDRHYMAVGYDAMRIIVDALCSNDRPPPRSILDFPSGSGRVTRHLRAMFPTARIGACDLYEYHVDFCAKTFGAEPLLSTIDLDNLNVGADWDLIFCGSLLTHLDADHCLAAIRFMERSLSTTGIAVATVEGRRAEWIQDNSWKLIGDDRFEIARRDYHAKGFGFVDYDTDFMKKTFSKQVRYGVTMIKPDWLMRCLQAMPAIRILGYKEGAWDRHQDVVIFGKPGNDGG